MIALNTKLAVAAMTSMLALTGVSAAWAKGEPDHREPAQDQPQRGPHHKKGERLKDADWRHSPKVDYRKHHLRAPPRGYEWHQVDGDYVMVAVATGLIASIIAGN